MSRRENPLDHHSADPIVRFACDLRQLRQRAGNPPYRVLAKVACFSASTLAQAAAGRTLPTLAVTVAYVRAGGGDAVAWEQRWHSVATALADDESPEQAEPDAGAPYVGLAAYQPQDAGLFFGRDAMIDELAEQVAQHRFVAVFGASGVGKSSLLRAGLIARTQRRDVALFTPGAHPGAEFARAVRESTGLLVVDQFEELFTLCPDQAERERFIAALVSAATDPGGSMRVVIGVRTDFFGHCVAHPELAELVRRSQFLVGPMTDAQLRAVITRPAAAAGVTMETALLTTVVADCAGQPGVLPLLSHALRETWRRRRGMTLTLAGYQAAGGIARALAQTAERTYARCDPGRRRVMKDLFLRLTALGEGTEDTKRRLDRHELDSADPDTGAVLEALVGTRLITVDDDSIEITHEALIRHWPRLRDWLGEDRDGLRIHRRLTGAARDWEALGFDRDSLYRGVRLHLAEEWAQRGAVLTRREHAFLRVSRQADAHARMVARRRARRLRILVALLSVLLVVAGISTIAVRLEGQTALLQRDSAEAQRILTQATGLLATNPGLAEQLALTAYRMAPGEQTADGVLNTVAVGMRVRRATVPGEILGLSGDGRFMVLMTARHAIQLWTLDNGHPAFVHTLTATAGAVLGAAFSPDNRLLILFGDDSAGHIVQPQMWTIADPARPSWLGTLPITSAEMRSGLTEAVFDSDRVVTTGAGAWNIADPRHPVLINAMPVGNADWSAFSRDGLAFADVTAGRLRLWDLSRPGRPRVAWTGTAAGSSSSVQGIGWFGDILAVVGGRSVALWNVADIGRPRRLSTIQARTGQIDGMSFSEDGTDLDITDDDHTAEIWDIASSAHPVRTGALTGYPDAKADVTFSADDRTLVTDDFVGTASPFQDSSLQWFDLTPAALTGDTSCEQAPAFSADGTTMITTGLDAAGILWQLGPTGPPSALGTVDADSATMTASANPAPLRDPAGSCRTTGAFSGHLLVTPGTHVMRVWDTTNPRHTTAVGSVPRTLAGGSVAITRHGRTLLAGSDAWDISDPRHPHWLSGLSILLGVSAEAQFSDDGTVVATIADATGTVVIYHDNGSAPPRRIASLPIHAGDIALRPDGALLAASPPYSSVDDATSGDGPVRLWDPQSGQPLSTLPDSAFPVVFSPDDRTVAVRDPVDNTVRLWDVTDPRAPVLRAVLTGVQAPLAFEPDSQVLAAADATGTLQLRETDVAQAIGELCSNTPRIDPADWQRYLADRPYQPPCTP